MHFSAFEKARISGFYFFTFPYLFDALFLSRMPALKAQTGATETEIGWVLLTLGLCGLCALLSGNQLLRRVGSRRLCPWSMLAMCVVLVLGTRATTVRLRRPFRVLPQCLGSLREHARCSCGGAV